MNLLAIITIIIFALCMLRGYRKGLIRTLASMISLILSIILVSFASPYVTEFLEEKTPVYQFVQEKCREAFVMEKKQDTAEDRKAQKKAIENLSVPDFLKTLLEENNTQKIYEELAVKNFQEYVPRFLAEVIMSMISFVLTWILVLLAIWLVVHALDLIAGLPVLHGLNRLLGAGLGLVQGLIIVWIGMVILTIFSNTEIGKVLMEMISENPFLKELYQRNLLLDLLHNMIGKWI